MHLVRSLAFVLVSTLLVHVLDAQVQFVLVKPELIQTRLNLYKGNDSAREIALKKTFEEAGCPAANLSEQVVPKRKQPNVICILPGSTPETIVVGAHFDHVSEGSGIIDNWSGASLLPSLFQSLLAAQHRHTYIFIGFTGEEEGEIGSTFYANQLSKDGLSRIHLMVNLDTLALGPTKVWGNRSDSLAVSLLAGTAHLMSLPLANMDVDKVGESDEESFIKRNVCTLTIHSITQQTLHVLHTPADAPSAVSFQDYYDSYHLLAAYLLVLDSKLSDHQYTCPSKRK